MKKITSLLLLTLLAYNLQAQDTFSIVAVDPSTGEVGAAGASCVDGAAAFGGLIDIISGIIPGRGGINSQAYVCIPNANLQNGLAEMESGASPSEIIAFLLANDTFPCGPGGTFDNPAYRQYGIADLDSEGNPRTAGFTGGSADDFKDDIQGATYSIQGNILLDDTVLTNMEANFNSTAGSLADKLMAAIQGANFAGADSRCLARGTSSTSAFLQVYAADDLPGSPYLRLNIEEMPFGEEPIDSLQLLYDNFLSTDENSLKTKLTAYPNPAEDILFIKAGTDIQIAAYSVYDITGKKLNVESNLINTTTIKIKVGSLPKGMYFVRVQSPTAQQTVNFLKD